MKTLKFWVKINFTNISNREEVKSFMSIIIVTCIFLACLIFTKQMFN